MEHPDHESFGHQSNHHGYQTSHREPLIRTEPGNCGSACSTYGFVLFSSGIVVTLVLQEVESIAGIVIAILGALLFFGGMIVTKYSRYHVSHIKLVACYSHVSHMELMALLGITLVF